MAFRLAVSCTQHARMDPTPVPRFMLLASEELGMRDRIKQTTVILLP